MKYRYSAPENVLAAGIQIFTATKAFSEYLSQKGFGALYCFVLIIFLMFCSSGVHSSELRIAAASDLKFVMDDLVQKFEKKYDAQDLIQVTYGSSGSFVAQFIQQAPFDLFFSANTDYIDLLIEKKLALADSKVNYALGSVVLWARNDAGVNFEKFGMNILLQDSIQKISLANPSHAPYGKAAEAALQSMGLYSVVKNKLVYAENVAQAAQFVQTGAAQVGVVALSLAKAPVMQKQGQYWLIPKKLYPPIHQTAVRMIRAKNVKKVDEFMSFIESVPGKKILEQYGLRTEQATL